MSVKIIGKCDLCDAFIIPFDPKHRGSRMVSFMGGEYQSWPNKVKGESHVCKKCCVVLHLAHAFLRGVEVITVGLYEYSQEKVEEDDVPKRPPNPKV